MSRKLYAIVDFYGEPYEDTCLCSYHYDANKSWHEMSYGAHSNWKEFEPVKTNTEYAPLSCIICGFPIGSEITNE